MNKRLIAYNSRKLSFTLLVVLIPIFVVIIMLIINAKELFHWIVLVGVIICFIFILSMFIYSLLLPNIAFEINDDKLIIYKIKKQKIILLKDINKFRLCDNSSSFDGCLWGKGKKIRLNYFIKNKKQILKELEIISKEYGFYIEYYSVDYSNGD